MKFRRLIRAALLGTATVAIVGIGATTIAQETGDVDVPRVEGPPEQSPAEIPDRSVQERLDFLLSGYEYFPTREDLDELGDAATIARLLRQMATDPDNRNTRRIRAVDALGYYDDEETLSLLTSLLAPLPQEVERKQLRVRTLLRHHAITAYARSQGTEGVERLAELLNDDELQIRLTVISALGKHGGKTGLKILRKQFEKTENAAEKRALRKWTE